MSKVYLRMSDSDPWTAVVSGDEAIFFDYTSDDLQNPTNYVSESSYASRLPRCPENNKFFSHICQIDSLIVAGGFNPAVKMQYLVLSNAGHIVSTGDAMLDEITEKEYILTLAGTLAHVFSCLMNAGWNTVKAAADNNYSLMVDWLKKVRSGSVLVDGVNCMDRALVYTSWCVDRPLMSLESLIANVDLKTTYHLENESEVSQTNAFIASLVGFAPTAQGRYQDFESDTWLEVGTFVDEQSGIEFRPSGGVAGNTDASYLPVLCTRRGYDNEPVNRTVDVKDGLVEPQLREYRSYYQQPYIYISALFEFFKHDFEAITGGYMLNLDSRWFNDSNDELYRLVYMLPQLFDEADLPVGEAVPTAGEKYFLVSNSASGESPTPQVVFDDISDQLAIPNVVQFGTGERAVFNGMTSLSFRLGVSIPVPDKTYYFAPCNAILVEVGVDGGEELYRKRYIICPLPTDNKLTEEIYYASAELRLYQWIAIGYTVLFPKYTPFTDTNDGYVDITDIEEMIGTVGGAGQRGLYIEYGLAEKYNAFVYFNGDQMIGVSTPPWLKVSVNGDMQVMRQYRSGAEISLERLFRDISPFEVLLQFTKTRHMLWLVDDEKKEVTVTRAQDWYADKWNEGPVDITEYADIGGGYILSPLSWDGKEVVLNFSDMGTARTKSYNDRFLKTYGSKSIRTQNTISENVIDLLGGKVKAPKSSAMLSQSIISRSDLEHSRQNYIETMPMPMNEDNGDSANIYGNFYYRHDNGLWLISSDVLQKAVVHITDDMVKEQMFLRFCWHGDDAYLPGYGANVHITTSKRPVLNTVSDSGLSVLFAPVREYYTSMPDVPSEFLYEHCWQRYIEEVYDLQNKTLQVAVNLIPAVFYKVRCNPFVVIGHILYVLTEIEGWSESNTKCRCTLRQIMNINNLTT